jgi:hypothetical protein
MKKFLKIFLAVFIGILLLLIVLPFFFVGKIERKMKDEINKQVNATVGWDKISLSLIRSFPDVTLGIEKLYVVGKKQFEKDTLVAMDQFSLTLDVIQAIKGNVQVKKILIDKPLFNAVVAVDSTVNWDIMIPSETAEAPVDTTAGEGSLTKLQYLKITDGRVYYIDRTMKLVTSFEGLDSEMSGDLGASVTILDILATVKNFSLKMDDTYYMKGLQMGADARLKSDIDKMVFTFEESDVTINKLSLGVDGWFGMPEVGYDLDMKLFARQTDFKTLLGLLPAEMLKDYESIKTTGKLALEATMKGKYIDTDHMPAFNFLLSVNDASIKYPDLPESIQDIQISMKVDNPGGSLDNTVTDIDKFHFKLGSNPFDANLNVIKPVSNATFNGGMHGTINLETLKKAIPLDSMTIKGIIAANIQVAGDYNMIEKEQYESIKADGSATLKGFEYTSVDLPKPFYIDNAELKFSPRFLDLSSFNSRMGESDYNLNGRLDNYLSYFLKDGVLKGNLALNSKYINLDELMALSSDDTTTVADTAATETVVIPKNIDFVMASRIDKMKYDKLNITNAVGNITIRDGRIVLDGLNMNMLGGSMLMAGQYNTTDPAKPFVDFTFDASKININEAANSFSVVDSILPIAKLAKGIVNTKFSFSSAIGKDMSPIMSTIGGLGSLKSEGINLAGSKVQTGLASMLKDDKYKSFTAKDLFVKFKLTNGNLFIEPFETKIYDKPVAVQGRQGLDKTMEYQLTMPVSREELSNLGGLLGIKISSTGADLPVDVIIKGKLTDPELALNFDKAQKQIEKEAGDQVTKEVTKEVEKLMEDPNVKKSVDDLKKKFKNVLK